MDAKQPAADNGNAGSLNHYFPRFIPKRFNETYLPAIGVAEGSPFWHTFRHTFKTGLKVAGVPKAVRDDLCGLADGSAGAGYEHDVSLAVFADAVNRLAFDWFTKPPVAG